MSKISVLFFALFVSCSIAFDARGQAPRHGHDCNSPSARAHSSPDPDILNAVPATGSQVETIVLIPPREKPPIMISAGSYFPKG